MKVLVGSLGSRWPDEYFTDLLEQLPCRLRTQILNFRQWDDAQRSLISKVLLLKGLAGLGFGPEALMHLKYSAFGRPYLAIGIDFNISHAGGYVLCAISESRRVGVDVEYLGPVDASDIDTFLSESELVKIWQSKNQSRAFYELWTQKEAFMKAIGCGFQIHMSNIAVHNNQIKWHNKLWFLHELKIDDKHVSHLCTDGYTPKISLEEVSFNV